MQSLVKSSIKILVLTSKVQSDQQLGAAFSVIGKLGGTLNGRQDSVDDVGVLDLDDLSVDRVLSLAAFPPLLGRSLELGDLVPCALVL